MIRTLTAEEIEQAKQEYDKWWNSLDVSDKSHIFHFCKDVLKSKEISEATKEWEDEKEKQSIKHMKEYARVMRMQRKKAKAKIRSKKPNASLAIQLFSYTIFHKYKKGF